jgi:hypothetical protein
MDLSDPRYPSVLPPVKHQKLNVQHTPRTQLEQHYACLVLFNSDHIPIIIFLLNNFKKIKNIIFFRLLLTEITRLHARQNNNRNKLSYDSYKLKNMPSQKLKAIN